MDFFKSFGRKRQSKAVTPLAGASATALGDAGREKAKSDDCLPSQQQTRWRNQHQPHGSSTSISTAGPAFRQVRWGESGSPASNPVSPFGAARGWEGEHSPSSRRRDESTASNYSPVTFRELKVHITKSPSPDSRQQQQHAYSSLGDTDHGEPSPLLLTTPEEEEEQQTIAALSLNREDELKRSPSQRALAESFAAATQTHLQKPSLGRRGAIYVSPNRQRHEKSPTAAALGGGSGAARRERQNKALGEIGEDDRKAASRDHPPPPKSEFLGDNMKRWEALLAQQAAALSSDEKTTKEPPEMEDTQPAYLSATGQQQQHGEEGEDEEEDIDEGEASGIGNRANEEAVEAVRRLGRGEFQAVFTDFERAHTRSATQQIQRQRTRSPDASSEQSDESGTSKHRPRSI